MATTADYDALRYQELDAISQTLHGLSDDQWDTPSLCAGWQVRHVVSHMCLGYTTPMPRMLRLLARYRGDVPRASAELSVAYGDRHRPEEILAVLDTVRRDHVRKGISKFIKSSDGFVDHVIHHSDVRRPLGLAPVVPEARLVAALDVVPTLGGFVKAKSRVAGLRLVADDVGWSAGDGPEVRGHGEALLLAASGRTVVLDELSGEGLDQLRGRLAA
jgi:uncharacterized protein (TIGR03083 family)